MSEGKNYVIFRTDKSTTINNYTEIHIIDCPAKGYRLSAAILLMFMVMVYYSRVKFTDDQHPGKNIIFPYMFKMHHQVYELSKLSLVYLRKFLYSD